MKTKTPSTHSTLVIIISIPFLVSCFPGDIRNQMDQNMKEAQNMFADQEFKKTIAYIELHKLRNGTYPASLNELQFLSAFDSSSFKAVEYHKLDSGYELNIYFTLASITGKQDAQVKLNYPPEFWKGLGCVKSNAM
jgi:hypothetical protein